MLKNIWQIGKKEVDSSRGRCYTVYKLNKRANAMNDDFDDIQCEEVYEDDGQPSTYEEYQDLYGGDDAFETCNYYEEY
jgi:hypothetical protein